jgi:hypothetical protein
MKKIKITEKQARLLETLNSKKVLKVTKEQYNRIIESELYRPNLTETPELHEEEMNEGLFREFVNELYGMNEEGKDLKFEKVCKLMEAAGLIESGKIVKEKFENNTKNVKSVIGKGLKMYEECGSAYKAVEMMEEALDNETIRTSKERTLANDGEPVVGYPKGGGRREIGYSILHISPFSELPESEGSQMSLSLPSLGGEGRVIIKTKEDLIGREFQGPKMMHKQLGYIADFKNKFGTLPTFININDKGADIDLEKAPKFKETIELYRRNMQNDIDSQREVGGNIDEMDSYSSGSFEGPLNQKPAFETNVYESLVALKKK